MRCLWLTCVDPYPEDSGQFIYSGRLIDSLTAAGAHVTVLCLARPEMAQPSDSGGDVRWVRVHEVPQPAWSSVFSPLPNMAFRWSPGAVRPCLRNLLETEEWDTIVFDGLFTGWALDPIAAHLGARSRRPALVYLAHNHEATTRRIVATNCRGKLVKRRLLLRDAVKARRLEERLVEIVDLVTALTLEDAMLFDGQHNGRPALVLPPGYCGRTIEKRSITRATPRRAVIVGSFDWIAKQINLQEFVAAADPVFARAGVELQVVGKADDRFLERLRRRARATSFVGKVESVFPYLDDARVAIVPERLGGGFKLKVLDYVFNRVPIAALTHSITGIPLKSGRSVVSVADHTALANSVVGVIDDLASLNDLHDRAFDDCAGAFSWRQRGEVLFGSIAAL